MNKFIILLWILVPPVAFAAVALLLLPQLQPDTPLCQEIIPFSWSVHMFYQIAESSAISLISVRFYIYWHGRWGVMKMENIAPRAGIEPISLSLHEFTNECTSYAP